MAKMVLTSEYLSLNSVDYSSAIRKCELVVEVADVEVTNMASGGWKEYLGGLKEGTLSIEFLQDYASSGVPVDANLWALLGTVTTFEVRPTSAVVGVSNPKWTGSVLVKTWQPVGGSVGDEATADVSFPTSGAVTRATA